MKELFVDYQHLFSQFLSGGIPVNQFQEAYLNLFKNEKRTMSEDSYELLEEVFGDVDAFTTDPELLAEQPDFYLDETRLRDSISKASKRLSTLAE